MKKFKNFTDKDWKNTNRQSISLFRGYKDWEYIPAQFMTNALLCYAMVRWFWRAATNKTYDSNRK